MKHIKQFIFEKLKLNNQSKLNNTSDEDLTDNTKWKVGDILCGVWSYSMTIPYFYKILKRTAKSFTIIELKTKIVSGHFNGQYEVMPEYPYKVDNDEKPITARIKKDGYVYANKVHLNKWDGKTPLPGNGLD